MRRHEELASGKVAGRTHEEVMESARQALQDSRVNAASPQGFWTSRFTAGLVGHENRKPVSTGFTLKHSPMPEPSIPSTRKRAFIITATHDPALKALV